MLGLTRSTVPVGWSLRVGWSGWIAVGGPYGRSLCRLLGCYRSLAVSRLLCRMVGGCGSVGQCRRVNVVGWSLCRSAAAGWSLYATCCFIRSVGWLLWVAAVSVGWLVSRLGEWDSSILPAASFSCPHWVAVVAVALNGSGGSNASLWLSSYSSIITAHLHRYTLNTIVRVSCHPLSAAKKVRILPIWRDPSHYHPRSSFRTSTHISFLDKWIRGGTFWSHTGVRRGKQQCSQRAPIPAMGSKNRVHNGSALWAWWAHKLLCLFGVGCSKTHEQYRVGAPYVAYIRASKCQGLNESTRMWVDCNSAN